MGNGVSRKIAFWDLLTFTAVWCIKLKKRLPFPSKKNVSFVPYNLRYLLSLSDRTVGVFLFSSFIFLELRHFCILVRVNWYPGARLHGTVCNYWFSWYTLVIYMTPWFCQIVGKYFSFGRLFLETNKLLHEISKVLNNRGRI